MVAARHVQKKLLVSDSTGTAIRFVIVLPNQSTKLPIRFDRHLVNKMVHFYCPQGRVRLPLGLPHDA